MFCIFDCRCHESICFDIKGRCNGRFRICHFFFNFAVTVFARGDNPCAQMTDIKNNPETRPIKGLRPKNFPQKFAEPDPVERSCRRWNHRIRRNDVRVCLWLLGMALLFTECISAFFWVVLVLALLPAAEGNRFLSASYIAIVVCCALYCWAGSAGSSSVPDDKWFLPYSVFVFVCLVCGPALRGRGKFTVRTFATLSMLSVCTGPCNTVGFR